MRHSGQKSIGSDRKVSLRKKQKTKKRTGESASAIHIYGSNLIGASRPAPFAITTSRTPANRIRLSKKNGTFFFLFSFCFIRCATFFLHGVIKKSMNCDRQKKKPNGKKQKTKNKNKNKFDQ
jgi:hypothetical protein